MKPEKIEMMFKLMEYDELTEKEEMLVVSFDEQFNLRGRLSERQIEVLEDIFKRAAGRVEWSR